MRRVGPSLAVVFLMCQIAGCRSGDPAERMILMVDQMPAEERPADWERTKALMARRPPPVGEPAPDFTLPTLNEEQTVTLSEFHPTRPKVLIFGSYT